MTLRRTLRYTLFAAAICALGLSGCGRRGPLELPPETQARGAALKAEEEARAARAPKARPAPGAAEAPKQDPAIPGTIGHRPPDQYPFPLDPLL
ncbi:lipoprotein [Methylocystis sp. WRRC1]|uniref:LPS translocon maturation chaperone LptM n=1 Tax=unclassified Methylocystis TaxID=2625913 RepID=UPI0003080D77|nr:lipoprotein [Methylocystis sp. ATCC 49242]MCC3245628.1 lipoprotein [Methylocystis sp. WRRC1]